ncbi:hypothetical protein MVES_003803 [Malassezia vespertilionis]|uniref:Tms1p n=2 Tax=Malassezia vespertilionis TaxID=2020962 RepID=A0A2N1J6W0_9BASI|nr:hypothetical protein MVES_003803 [Malassezia vespertilionis]
MDCHEQESCFGVFAVHRITFALALFHMILALLLMDVTNTRSKRAAIQNGWWGPKIAAWLFLVVFTFLIPNPFFMFWANYIAPLLAMFFILIGLVLLVDVAHSWSEWCLDQWERHGMDGWMYLLVSSTVGLYASVLGATFVLYHYFAPAGCAANRTFITINLVIAILLTILCVHPRIQEANPRSGLAQSSVVLAYCTYLLTSALMNRDNKQCNPIARGRGETTKSTTVMVGALFTFVAIAYSTTRAATQSQVLVGNTTESVALAPSGYEPVSMAAAITEQPQPKEPLRIQAIRSAIDAGALPASALDEEIHAQDEEEALPPGTVVSAPLNDDERSGTRYNYSFFHIIFAMAVCYMAMLLTDWQTIKIGAPPPNHGQNDSPMVYIGVSPASMWIRIVSSWACALLYSWTLLAPVVMPERFGYV